MPKKPRTISEIARERGVTRQALEARLNAAGSRDTYHDLARERAELARAQREKIERENRVRDGELVPRADVEAAHAEMREVLRSDLLGALPLRLAGELAGRSFTAPEVRATVLRAVNAMIASWSTANYPVPDDSQADSVADALAIAEAARPAPRPPKRASRAQRGR